MVDAPKARDLLRALARGVRPRLIPRLIESEDADLLVARWDEEVVTLDEALEEDLRKVMLAHRSLTLFAGGPILQIVELFVEESRRGQGIGQALVLVALEQGWAMGCVETVVPTRRASRFYRRLGFAPTAEFLKMERP